MNFDDAIKAHSAWKLRLQSYLSNPDKSINPNDVCKDNLCDLGKWIHGDGKKFESMEEFKKLKSEHAKFHKAASDVVIKADNGQSVSEETQLGAKSDFAQSSTAVVTAIMAMKRKAA